MVETAEKENQWKDQKQMWDVNDVSGARWSFWSEGFIKDLSCLPGVKGTMAMGTVLAIELDGGGGESRLTLDPSADGRLGYSSHAAGEFLSGLKKEVVQSEHGGFGDFQIHSRPLGNVVYLMTSLFTKSEVVRAMEEVIKWRLTEFAK